MITEVNKTRIVLNILFIFNYIQLLHKLTMETAKAIFKSSTSFELRVISTSLLYV
jgi:hypothetical protein